jgi:nucleoid-associated protein YgaU
MHPIAEGETLYAICKREYGDGSLSTALAKYNRKAIPDPTRIRKGVTIRIPPVEVLKPGAARKTESASVPEAGVGVPVAAMAAADIVTIDSRTPIGGEVTLEVKPQPEPKAKAAPKAAAKSSPKQSTGKPTKKPVAAKSPDR